MVPDPEEYFDNQNNSKILDTTSERARDLELIFKINFKVKSSKIFFTWFFFNFYSSSSNLMTRKTNSAELYKLEVVFAYSNNNWSLSIRNY